MAAFYLDNDVPTRLAELLSTRGHDASTTYQQGRSSASDAEQLLRAAEQGRILVTHNRKDYTMLHDAWVRWSETWGVHTSHAGILTLPQPPAVQVARLADDVDGFVRSGLC